MQKSRSSPWTADRTIASVRTALLDVVIQTNQMSPFRLGLRTVGAEARIDLYYEYRVRSFFGMGAAQMSRSVSAPGTCARSRNTASPSRSPNGKYPHLGTLLTNYTYFTKV